MAQLVEQGFRKAQVGGSIPSAGSTFAEGESDPVLPEMTSSKTGPFFILLCQNSEMY